MALRLVNLLKYIILLVTVALFVACEKEHLQPNPGEPDPLVYILARIGADSIRLAGGVDSYIGSTSTHDLLTNRVFTFTLKDPHSPNTYFQISINNYRDILGEPQADLDNSIYPGIRHFQEGAHFIPLAATVVWFDENGIRFSSDLSNQTHPFSILSVEDVTFEGKSYKKTVVEFDCNLMDSQGHILHLIHGRASILFGVN